MAVSLLLLALRLPIVRWCCHSQYSHTSYYPQNHKLLQTKIVFDFAVDLQSALVATPYYPFFHFIGIQ